MYELWATQGQGGSREAYFRTLKEALAHIDQHKGKASFAIKYPDGSWHQWDAPEETS